MLFRRASLALALVLFIPAPRLLAGAGDAAEPSQPQALEEGDGFEVERFERFEELGEAADGIRRVVVDNAFGNIRARFGGYGDQVELRAVLQHFEDEGSRLEVRSSRGERGLELTVGERQGDSRSSVPRAEWRKRADLAIFVPDGVAFESHATGGLTELKGLHGDVVARSAGGEIVARKIDGDLDLESESGHVLAVPKQRRSETPQRLRSGGELTIYFFDEADVALEGRSRGLVSTDFSIAMAHDDGEKQIALELGKGTTPILAEAGEHLRLVRKPSADRARPRRGELADTENAAAVTEETAGETTGEAATVESGAGSGHDDVEVRAVAGEAQEISTITGDITLLVPEGGSFTVELATSGEITVDYPVEIEYRYHEEPAKKGLITIGSGSTTIRLESRRGAIRVFRAP